MQLPYFSYRKRVAPVAAADIDALDSAVGFPIACGYRECLLTFGTGVIGEEIGVLAPGRVLAQTREHFEKRYVDPDVRLPEPYRDLRFAQSVLVAQNAGRITCWAHPGLPGSLIIYDGDFDRTFVAPSGLADPLHANGDDVVFALPFPHLTFDSRLDAMSVILEPGRRAKHVNPSGFLNQVMRHWFRAGDIMDGRLESDETMTCFMKGLGGFVRMHRKDRAVIDRIVFDHDVSEADHVSAMVTELRSRGYVVLA